MSPEASDKLDGVVWAGNGDLRTLLVPVGSLHEDPANTNTHPEESIRAIAASYAEYGQQRPVVASKAGVVKAGNGQLAAARRLGWTHLAVSRSDLPDVKLALFGVADNRTAEFSKRDEEAIARVLELARDCEPIEATGYSVDDLDALLGKARDAADEPDGAEAPEEFAAYDEAIVTMYQCPQCAYAWSGKPK